MNHSIHFVLQGKGGIGKSFCATMLAQYLDERFPGSVQCLDTDQENTTFSHYKALSVQHVNVMNSDRTINRKRFDSMMETLFATSDNIVVDNGANTFSPLMAYLVENEVIPILQDAGKTPYVHTIVGGGDVLHDTSSGFISVARALACPLIVWLNEHFGSTASFQESEAFLAHSQRVRGIVLLKARNSDTFGDDIKRMNTARVTVKEVMEDPSFTVMEKQRIKMVSRDIFAELDQVEW